MAVVTGTQSIPSGDLDGYRELLTEKTPDGIVRRRYPYRLPELQNIGGKPSAAQIVQRSRFRQAIDKFKTLSAGEKTRWYEAQPSWGSFLWYYNYFILSALMSITGLPGGALAVIKSINYYTAVMTQGTPYDKTVAISAVDPNKAVCMLFGAGAQEMAADAYVPVYPYPKSLGSSALVLRMSMPIVSFDAEIGVLLIEYI